MSIAVAAVAKAERERRAAKAKPLPQRNRRFRLTVQEPPGDGLKRIALGQLDLAIELLRDESELPPERAIHETRKALKRLRALLALLEGELSAKRCAREHAVLRDAARRLAGARDAEVALATLDALLARHPRKLGGRRALLDLRRHLQRRRIDATAQILGDAGTRAQVAGELAAMRGRVAKWQLASSGQPSTAPTTSATHPGVSAYKLTRAGLRGIYRAGRKGRRRAARRKAPPTALHRWRKHVKDLRYALEVLDVQGKSAERSPSKRSASKRITKLAKRADALGELLGEEHDLLLLAELARAHKPLKGHPRARKALLRAIARRRAKLRRRALRDGERLYARKPKRFVGRMRA